MSHNDSMLAIQHLENVGECPTIALDRSRDFPLLDRDLSPFLLLSILLILSQDNELILIIGLLYSIWPNSIPTKAWSTSQIMW
jgi:hypothetical protein